MLHFGAGRRFVRWQPSGDADVNTLIAAMTVTPDATRQALINTTITAFKAAGVWSKLDVLYVIAAHDSQAARLNWKNPAAFNLTAVNSPVFTVDRGYEGNGTSANLGTGWNAGTQGVNNTLNSAVLGVWVHKASTINSTYLLYNGTGSVLRSSAGTLMQVRVYDATVMAFATGATTGHIASRRTTATERSGWLNGVSQIADAQVSTTIGTIMTLLSATSSGWSDCRLSAAYAGGGFSDAEMLAMHNAGAAYMTAVGA